MWDWLTFQIGYWAGFILTWAVILSPVALIAWLVWRRLERGPTNTRTGGDSVGDSSSSG